MHCHKCDRPLQLIDTVPALMGFEDEKFPLCQVCLEEFQKQMKKAKSKKAKEKLMAEWLKRCSEG